MVSKDLFFPFWSHRVVFLSGGLKCLLQFLFSSTNTLQGNTSSQHNRCDMWWRREHWARTSKTQRWLWAADSEMWENAQIHPSIGVVWNMWATHKPNIWAQAASWGNYSAFLSWLAWAQRAQRYGSRRNSAFDWLLVEIPSVALGEYAGGGGGGGGGVCRKHIHVQGRASKLHTWTHKLSKFSAMALSNNLLFFFFCPSLTPIKKALVFMIINDPSPI